MDPCSSAPDDFGDTVSAGRSRSGAQTCPYVGKRTRLSQSASVEKQALDSRTQHFELQDGPCSIQAFLQLPERTFSNPFRRSRR